MSAHCRLTGVKPAFGNNVSHSHRRSQWKAAAPGLVPITVNGRELLVPRRLIRAYQRGLITVE